MFAIVLYLRYGLHLRGRRAALWTIMAFALLIVTLVIVMAMVRIVDIRKEL